MSAEKKKMRKVNKPKIQCKGKKVSREKNVVKTEPSMWMWSVNEIYDNEPNKKLLIC